MRFFKRREQEPQGQPKEASELPIYREDAPVDLFLQNVRGLSRELHDEQHMPSYCIRERDVVKALLDEGYICDRKSPGNLGNWYYTNAPLRHGTCTTISGLEIVCYGANIETPAFSKRRRGEERWQRLYNQIEKRRREYS